MERFGVFVLVLAVVFAIVGAGPVSAAGNSEPVHVVQSGETLSRIAQLHGIVWTVLAEYNALANPHSIFPGQVIRIPVMEQEIATYVEEIALFPFQHGDMWGFRDAENRVVIEPQFVYAWEFSEGLAGVTIGHIIGQAPTNGFINKSGEIMFTTTLTPISQFNHGVVSLVTGMTSTHDVFLLDTEGNLIGGRTFQFFSGFRDGLAVVLRSGDSRMHIFQSEEATRRFSFINTAGEWATDMEFEQAQPFNNGYARVLYGNRWGTMDTDFNIVFDAPVAPPPAPVIEFNPHIPEMVRWNRIAGAVAFAVYVNGEYLFTTRGGSATRFDLWQAQMGSGHAEPVRWQIGDRITVRPLGNFTEDAEHSNILILETLPAPM